MAKLLLFILVSVYHQIVEICIMLFYCKMLRYLRGYFEIFLPSDISFHHDDLLYNLALAHRVDEIILPR